MKYSAGRIGNACPLPDQLLQRAFHAYSARSRLLLPVVAKTALQRSPSLGLHDVQQMPDRVPGAKEYSISSWIRSAGELEL
jgi:hypothetical protein